MDTFKSHEKSRNPKFQDGMTVLNGVQCLCETHALQESRSSLVSHQQSLCMRSMHCMGGCREMGLQLRLPLLVYGVMHPEYPRHCVPSTIFAQPEGATKCEKEHREPWQVSHPVFEANSATQTVNFYAF